jgi:prepilin-type processing-associated H-X9-DG protein
MFFNFSAANPTPIRKDGMFHFNTRTKLTDVPDGTSGTILMGERSHFDPLWPVFRPSVNEPTLAHMAVWTSGGANASWRFALVEINWRLPDTVVPGAFPVGSPAYMDLYHKRHAAYGSQHPGGANITFVDGSVRFVAERINLLTLQGLSTREGGEIITEDL